MSDPCWDPHLSLLFARARSGTVSYLLMAEPREHHPVSAACPHVVRVTAVLLCLGRGGANFERSS